MSKATLCVSLHFLLSNTYHISYKVSDTCIYLRDFGSVWKQAKQETSFKSVLTTVDI